MDPLTAAAIGQGVNLLGSVIGGNKAAKAAEQNAFLEQQRIQEAIAQLGGIDTLSEEDLRVIYENPELVGEIQEVQLGQTELDGISLDPRYQQAQLKALADLQEIGQTGLTTEDRVEFDRLREDATADDTARQKSILQNLAQTGTLDSGNALIAKLQSNSDATQSALERGRDLASQSAQARRDAISQAANVASNLQQNDFNRQNTVASAKDTINRYNAENRQSVQGANLSAAQNIENARANNVANQSQANVNARSGANQAELARYDREQSLYNQNSQSQQANNATQANNSANLFSSLGDAAGSLASTYAQYNNTSKTPTTGTK